MPPSSSDDLAVLKKRIEESTAALETALREAPHEPSEQHRREGVWTPLQILEHVTIIDRLVAAQFRSVQTVAEQPIYRADKEEQITRDVASRDKLITAPERTHPKNAYRSLEEGLGDFHKLRSDLMEMITERASDLRRVEMRHPMLGQLSGYEFMLALAAHSMRHAGQVQEMTRLSTGVTTGQ